MNQTRYPAGKLPPAALDHLIQSYTHRDPRLVVPPGLGEDAAVIEFGDRYLVAKTDPITFATDAIGWYAVHVNANDIAAMGARPRFFLATILLPADQATPSLVESIFRSIHKAAGQLDIAVCGGHTEITHGIDRPIVVGQMLGEVEPANLVRSSGLRPGDALVLTKGLAIEATAIIAREKRPELLQRGYPEDFLEKCGNYLEDPGISVVHDARIAATAGPLHAMHDPTEGGVATGLFELASASDVGLEIFAEALYIAPESARLCAEFALDPLGVISSGALLIGCAEETAPSLITALEKAGIRAARIGTATPPEAGLVLRRGTQVEPLPHFPADEITHLFED
jgi:hydrogenase expression/formation protein HypE